MDGFKTIRLKEKTVKRYKGFSRKMGATHSAALEGVMDFFEWHGFTPSDRFGESIIGEIIKNRKRTEASIARTNATIAIIKDIEKRQTKPTTAMLHSLFEGQMEDEEPLQIEKKFADLSAEEKIIEETTVPKIRYERMESRMREIRTEFAQILDLVEPVTSRFGKDYLKLELSLQEFKKLRQRIKNL